MIGRSISHYEVLEKLGEGGMGVVYKARDTRLDRLVAIKVLPPERGHDPERRARFVQEAKAASALNHPNIITIHDIGTDGGRDFIAMEYVAGKTLDQLTPRKGMRLNDALKIAIQIAAALARAHGAGIIHRDLKPGNIMVDEHGTVKVLDFGLAKLTEQHQTGELESTETLKPRTEQGTILGTVGYMSPEQAEGRKLDARSDIFSFGSVLYEMVTGRRAFRGDSKLSTLAAIMNQEPVPLAAETPRDLEKIITRCLRKDSARRFQHMDDVKVALEELHEESESGKLAAAEPAQRRQGRPRLVWVAGLVLVVAGGLGVWRMLSLRDGTRPLTLTRFTSDAGLTTDPAISPDGSLIAYASDRANGTDLDIWVQHRGGGAPIRITRGEGDEREPSFSPDGSQLAYSGDGIYIVSSLGSEPRRIAPAGSRPRFSPDGKQILFSSGGRILRSNIWLVDLAGGTPRQLQHEFPWADYPVWSPDGKFILFFGRGQGRSNGWWVTSPADEPARRLCDELGQPEQWLPNGKILYSSWPSPQSLTNDLFIANVSSLKEQPRRLTGATGIVGPISVSVEGTAALFASGAVMANLWTLPFDPVSGKITGEMQAVTQEVAVNWYPSISADGHRLVYSSTLSGNPEIWFMDTATGVKKALTVGPAIKYRPVITGDGNRVAYTRMELPASPTIWTVEIADIAAPGAPRKVCDSGCGLVWDWSLDGQGLLFSRTGLVTAMDFSRMSIGFLRLPGGEVSEYLADPQRAIFQAHPSPDGRWVTVMYSGEIRVAPVRNGKPAGPSEWKIAVKGGADLPRWAPDGNTLYFLSARDSFRCFWAQRLDPKTKDPVGEPFAVQHFHRARRSLRYIQDSGAIGPAVARDRIVFPLAEMTGNVWLTRLKVD